MLATTSVHIGPEEVDRAPGPSEGPTGYEEGCVDANTSDTIPVGPSIEHLEQAIEALLSAIERYLLVGPPPEIMAAVMTYAQAVRDASQHARLVAEARVKSPTVMLGYNVKYTRDTREEQVVAPEGTIEYNVDVEEDDSI